MSNPENYPGLIREVMKNGSVRWRVRVKGDKRRRIALEVAPGHADFKVHYEAAREGRKPETIAEERTLVGSLDDLRKRFLAWMETQVEAGNLSPYTLMSRRTGLTQACDVKSPKGIRMGRLSADMPMEAFAHIRDSFGARTGAGATCLKALRAAYTWGAEHGFPKDSPVFRVKKIHAEKGGAVPWTDADIARFLDRHGPGTMARRWYYLARDTSGRIGDTRRLGPANEVVEGEALCIDWQPGNKGSERVILPMSRDLMIELAGLDPDAPAYLLTEQGRPFASSGSLDNAVRRWVIQAGLCEEVRTAKGKIEKKATRSQHGIRKRRAIDIAEAGGSIFEVMANLSHSDLQTAKIYTRRVDRAKLTRAAAARLAEREGNVVEFPSAARHPRAEARKGVPQR